MKNKERTASSKVCTRCGVLKHFKQFRPNGNHPDGVNQRCNDCIAEMKENVRRARDKGVPASQKIKAYFEVNYDKN